MSEAGFEAHRAHLVGLAYRMTGSWAEAEDVVQEAWLRWQRAGPEPVEHPRAWLSRVTTRIALDVLTSARRRREQYVGPWLPEPVVEGALDAEQAAALADDVQVALLLALERLSPLERAAFLLHDVFDLDYAEIAATLDRSEAACRQLVSRSRRHVRGVRRRQPVDEAEHARLIAAFGQAAGAGDLQALRDLLAEDVVLHSDGGGQVVAARRPVHGAEAVARFSIAVARAYPFPDGATVCIERLHGAPGVVVRLGDRLLQTIAFDIEHGRITAIHAQRNPDKLAALGR